MGAVREVSTLVAPINSVRTPTGSAEFPSGAGCAEIGSGSSDEANISVIRLDYLSCVLTILSTVMVGRKFWLGWVVAAINSILICVIGMRTSQTGFIPANLFCIALYAYNLHKWRDA